MDSKKWKYWQVGYYTHKGYWVKITTVFAPDRGTAVRKARIALSRPGRHTLLRYWREQGYEVLEQ